MSENMFLNRISTHDLTNQRRILESRSRILCRQVALDHSFIIDLCWFKITSLNKCSSLGLKCDRNSNLWHDIDSRVCESDN